MRRGMAWWGILLLVAWLAASCGPAFRDKSPGSTVANTRVGDAGSPTALDTNPCAEVVTLRLWHHWGGSRLPLMEEQIRRFEERHPCVQVEMTLLPWPQRLATLLDAVDAGDPPDVTMIGRQDVPALVEAQALLPLDSWMEQDGVSPELFYAAEIAGTRYQNQTWMLPMPTAAGSKMLWINAPWFRRAGLNPEHPPTTWAQLGAACRSLTQFRRGALERIGLNVLDVHGQPGAFLTWLYANGGTWISDDLRTVTFDGPEGIETLRWMVDFTNSINGGVARVEAFYRRTGDWEDGPFYHDYEAMMVAGTWEYHKIQTYAPHLAQDLIVTALPRGPSASANRGVAYGGWGYAVPRNVRHPEWSWALLKWLTVERDGACWFLQQQKRPSPLKACNEDPATGAGNPYWSDFLAIMAQDVHVPVTPVQPEVEQILRRMTEDAIYGVRSPEEALAWASAEIQARLDRYWASR
ncbi:MAG: sugar ABC transporter substrate-binding protein [Litorilinea sp.]|nr:MAG: sugar ABC transporter substrate-binding protein [Litorilinea sp.]